MNNKYKQGYIPKIQYWLDKYLTYMDTGLWTNAEYALTKLTYFTTRQKEVYGSGEPHSII